MKHTFFSESQELNFFPNWIHKRDFTSQNPSVQIERVSRDALHLSIQQQKYKIHNTKT